MSDDLTSRLLGAAEELERSVAAADPVFAGGVRAAIARRRAVRHVREVASGLVVATVIGVGAWAATGPDAPPSPPVTTPSPTVTPAPDPSPSPTLSPTPSSLPPVVDAGPPVREDDVDDATVLARLREPRTGEVWITPEPAPDLGPVLSPEDYTDVWHVGRRGDSDIYAVMDDSWVPNGMAELFGVPVLGLFEVDAAGARAIACPSARTTDPCAARTADLDVPQDETTFYDTMTLPRSIDLGAGWTLTTAHTTSSTYYPDRVFGDGGALYGLAGDAEVVADLGGLQDLELVKEGDVPGLADHRYAIRMPLGTTLALSADDAPGGEFGAIRWDDGVPRPLTDGYEETQQSTAPGSGGCFGGTFSVAEGYVAADWRAAGTTPGGHRVYVPVEGGNVISRAVRVWQEEASGTIDETTNEWVTGAAAGYRYTTDEAFLDAHALYAVEGPTGEWQLRLRIDALQTIWECV